ncbi:hypothetical protein BT69DRAFT_1279871 [Atractiella rhizophila]|nr:hypothetical protein BT69DRAFT_1279871 [Atractiella rhizophila]
MDKWAALIPSPNAPPPQGKQSAVAATIAKQQKYTSRSLSHIGRLPEEAFILIFSHLPLPDIVNLARGNRRLGRLSKDERVWKRKWRWMEWKGPYEVLGIGSKKENGNGTNAIDASGSHQLPPTTVAPTPGRSFNDIARSSAFTIGDDDDDEFGAFSSGSASTSATPISTNGSSDFDDFVSAPLVAPNSTSLQVPQINGITRTPDITPSITPSRQYADPFDMNSLNFDATASSPSFSPNLSAPSLPSSKPKTPDLFSFEEPVKAALPPLAVKPTTPRSNSPFVPNGVFSPTSPKSKLSKLGSIDTTYRELFMALHAYLLPFYLSFQIYTTNSLLFTSRSPSSLPSCAHTSSPVSSPSLSTKVSHRHGAATPGHVVYRNLMSATDFFESTILAEFDSRVLWELNGGGNVIQSFCEKRPVFYDNTAHNPTKKHLPSPNGEMGDGIDFTAMDEYMKWLLETVKKDGSLIARVFPPEADVLIYFADRIASEVLSEYTTTLLSAAQNLRHPLFLLATAATFAQCYRLVETVCTIEPKNEKFVTRERAEDVVFRMFEQHMDDYLQEEGDWIKEVLEGICTEWDTKVANETATVDATFLTSQNPAMTASLTYNVIKVTSTGALNTVTQLGNTLGSAFTPASQRELNKPAKLEQDPKATNGGGTTAMEEWQQTTPRASLDTSTLRTETDASSIAPTVSTMPTDVDAPSRPESVISTSSNPASVKENKVHPGFERMQFLLSLDTSLALIQADRESLKRVQTFLRYPGTYGAKVRDTLEEIFIILLQTLNERHIKKAFQRASQQMSSFKPEVAPDGQNVAPLVQFFELVHIGDTIQQMVQAYFDKEMANRINRTDFLNAVVREKKKFEQTLDDSVAQGLHSGVSILMNNVEYIITSKQDPRDFCPEVEDLELRPTLACREAIECLRFHCNMLKGSTDKHILEVFYQEVGIRLHTILCKHLKRSIISIHGGFQVISDLNAYHAFIVTLKQQELTAYFTALKMIGQLFIIDSPKDLGQLVRDVHRYDGTVRAEDLYEFIQRRTDWKKIDKQVEKELFGLQLSQDCIIA